jgi:nucleoside-diphosphate-sugar epimerase
VSDIARIVVDEVSPTAQIEYTGSERGWAGDVLYTDIDISLLKSFGWKPSISIELGVRLYVKWLRERFGSVAGTCDAKSE